MAKFLPPLLVVLAIGCDSGKAAIDPATLDAATVVFAATSGGGFLSSPEEEFFVGTRHGRFGLWIYGDRRAVLLREDTLQTLGYRVYRQGTVDDTAFRSLLDQASNLGLDGTHRYSACSATDGGGQGLAVALPGVAFVASSYMGFEVYDDCEGDAGSISMGEEGKPPSKLVAFAKGLFDVEVAEAVELVPDRIVLAGLVVEDDTAAPGYGCPADSPEWAVAGVRLPSDDAGTLWTKPLEGQQAADARAFVREHLQPSTDGRYRSACVMTCYHTCLGPVGHAYCSSECASEPRLYRVVYDDAPEGEESWPF